MHGSCVVSDCRWMRADDWSTADGGFCPVPEGDKNRQTQRRDALFKGFLVKLFLAGEKGG